MNNCAHSIHVCYSLYDANGTYCKFLGTSMLSLLENTSSCVTIHILHDNTLTKENKDKFIRLVNYYGQKLQFHSLALDDKVVEKFKLTQFSPGTLYRLSICDTLPVEIEKAIYLDADTIIHLDIKELWEEDLEGAEIGGCIDIGHIELCKHLPIPPFFTTYNVEYERCLNAGILLLDLKKLRANFPNFFRDSIEWLCQPRDFPVYDGEVINFFFNKTYKALPYKYNTSVHYEMTLDNPIIPSIYHYVTTATLGIFDNPYNQLFWHYFAQTPWCNGGFILRIFNIIKKLTVSNVENMERVMFILNNAHKRKFIVENKDIKSHLQSLFPENNNNIYQILNAPPPLKIEMRNGELSVFIVQYYKGIKDFLEQHGYRENDDFLDGSILYRLSGLNPMEQYQIIKDL